MIHVIRYNLTAIMLHAERKQNEVMIDGFSHDADSHENTRFNL